MRVNNSSKSEKPKREYKHYPVGTNAALINDQKYTERIQKRLKRNLNLILGFAHDWQIWLIRHPEYLPNPPKNGPRPVLKDPKLDRLLRLFTHKISTTEKFSRTEKHSLTVLIADIYENDGGKIDESIRQSINALFIGKVVE